MSFTLFKVLLQSFINLDSNPTNFATFMHDATECIRWLVSYQHLSIWKFINFIIVPAVKFLLILFKWILVFMVELSLFYSTIHSANTFCIFWDVSNTIVKLYRCYYYFYNKTMTRVILIKNFPTSISMKKFDNIDIDF